MASALSLPPILSSLPSKSPSAKSLLTCRFSSLVASQSFAFDVESAFVASSLRKLKPFVRFIHHDGAFVASSSHVFARYTLIRAYTGDDSGNAPEAEDEDDGNSGGQRELDADDLLPNYESYVDGVEIAIEKIGMNQRRIRSKVAVRACLQTTWNILTDYERLADFIPGLAVSKLLEKREKFARLYQVGEQNLAFGLKFNAKGTLDCFERDLETFPFAQRRDIDFKMVEGDFQLFEGTWSVEQARKSNIGDLKTDNVAGQEFQTTLHYVVRVKPKVWLPVHLVEGRLCNEIVKNLSCIREEAERAFQSIDSVLQ